jgi:hypothetical protein
LRGLVRLGGLTRFLTARSPRTPRPRQDFLVRSATLRVLSPLRSKSASAAEPHQVGADRGATPTGDATGSGLPGSLYEQGPPYRRRRRHPSPAAGFDRERRNRAGTSPEPLLRSSGVRRCIRWSTRSARAACSTHSSRRPRRPPSPGTSSTHSEHTRGAGHRQGVSPLQNGTEPPPSEPKKSWRGLGVLGVLAAKNPPQPSKRSNA